MCRTALITPLKYSGRNNIPMKRPFIYLTLISLAFMLAIPCAMLMSENSELDADLGDDPFTMISAGHGHNIALKEDGTVWAWGYNYNGQLGDGTTVNKTNAVQVLTGPDTPLTNIIAVSAGSNHSVALKGDGTVWAWGLDNNGQLGNGHPMGGVNTTYAAMAKWSYSYGLEDIIAISAGNGHTLALKNDGTVWAWGNDTSGQLGSSKATGESALAVQMETAANVPLEKVTDIKAGSDHSIVLKEDGTVWACGRGNEGQIGNGAYGTGASKAFATQTLSDASNPLSGVTAIAAGSQYNIALKGDGTVWAWGQNNQNGQLGCGSTGNKYFPVQVKEMLYNLTDVIAITSGFGNSVALKSDGTVWAWGNNDLGQIGNNTIVTELYAVQVKSDASSGLTDVIAVATGGTHMIAVKNNGTVWAWGDNSLRQLGNDSVAQEELPVQVGLTLFAPVKVTNISVSGTGDISTLTSKGETLQMIADVTPVYAVDKSIIWSVTDTKIATISSTGLLTAISNGTVTVKATAVDGSGIVGTKDIKIDYPILVESITVSGSGGATEINTKDGTLPMVATVLPTNATIDDVTWSVTDGTGKATIDANGVLKAVSNGTVTVKATAKDTSNVFGTAMITIKFPVLVESIVLSPENPILNLNGMVQISVHHINPATATNKNVVWSITEGSEHAEIDQNGLVTAISLGDIKIRATAADGSGVYKEISTTILGEPETRVESIVVRGLDDVNSITIKDGTLQMTATVLPTNATNPNVIWSVTNGAGNATIDANGLLTAVSDGTVIVSAVAADGSGIHGEITINISGQTVTIPGNNNGDGDSDNNGDDNTGDNEPNGGGSDWMIYVAIGAIAIIGIGCAVFFLRKP